MHEHLLLNEDARLGSAAKSRRTPLLVGMVLLTVLAAVFLALFIWRDHQLADARAELRQRHADPIPPTPTPPVAPAALSAHVRTWILSAMDTTADPCEDFMQYTCGTWQAANPVSPDGDSILRMFQSIQNISTADLQAVLNDKFTAAGEFLSGCVSFAPTNISDPDYLQSVRALDFWLTLIDAHLNVSAPSVSDVWYLMGQLHAMQMGNNGLLGIMEKGDYYGIFDDVMVWMPPHGGSYRYALPWTLPQMLQRVQDDLAAAGARSTLFDASTDTATSAYTKLMALGEEYSNMADTFPDDENFPPARSNWSSLEGLLDSAAYVRGLGDHSLPFILAGINDGVDRTGYADHVGSVHLLNPGYSRWVANNITQTVRQCAATSRNEAACARMELWKLQLKGEVLADLLKALPSSYSVLGELPTLSCRQQLDAAFENVYQHQEFVEFFGPGTTAAVTDMVDRVYTELGRTLVDTPWLDQATRTRALNKWELMTRNVAYESSWYNDHYGLAITGTWPLDLVAGRSYARQRWLSSMDVTKDLRNPDTVGMDPFTLNAFYNPMSNSINMLPGMMIFPAFDAGLPMMLNLAAYGWIIGHEMTHGFDNHGRLYDASGNKNNWWTQHAVEEFNAHAQCLEQQYNSVRVLGVPLNGSTTLGENIADNGGIGLAYRAYQALSKDASTNITQQLLSGTSITNEQLFWIWSSQLWCQSDDAASVAKQVASDVHSPGEARGFVPMQNRREFAAAFSCSATSRMGRSLTKDKCQVW